MIRRLLILVCLLEVFCPGGALASITLDTRTALFVDAREPAPIQLAARDLASDLEKVLGRPARIVHQPSEASPVVIWVACDGDLPKGVERPSGWEKLSMQAVSDPWPGSPAKQAIVLTGSDVRGTIYAIYEFAEQYLGIDPLYYWTDHQPARRAAIEIPSSLNLKPRGPVLKYRGFFINDEDLLTGWAPGEKKDHTGISLEVWNKVYETILRLKGNIVAPGTWIFSSDPQIKLAGERGLIITQHHAIPLGLNVARWPKDVPYNFSTHPEILERAWKNAVAAYPRGQEVLWTVGLRGLSDVSYASMDPSVRGNNQALGRLISKAIADQMRIVRERHPDAQFITSLWQEGARLAQQGDLTIPPEVSAVWPDDGYGYLQDKDEVAKGQGAYYHIAVMNFRANQLSEMVPVERIFSELGRYIQAGATNYLLVNTSDIRPVPLTLKAIMEAAWKGVPAGGADAGNQFIRRWAADEFGPRAASQVAGVYEDYFKAPARSGSPEHEYGDQLYHTEARHMLLTYMIDAPLYAIPSQAPKWVQPRIFGHGAEYTEESGKPWLNQAIQTEIEQCGNAQPRWDAVWKKALAAEPLVAPARRPFYHAHVLAMIAINRESNRMLFQVSKAIQEAQAGQTTQARASTAAALEAFNGIDQAEKAAEYGKWRNWYRGDWLTGVYRTRQVVEVFSKFLSDPLTRLSPPIFWDGWEAYYHIMHYEGNRSADVN